MIARPSSVRKARVLALLSLVAGSSGCGETRSTMATLLAARHYREALCNEDATPRESDELSLRLARDLAPRARLEPLSEAAFAGLTGISFSYMDPAVQPVRLTLETDRVAVDEIELHFDLRGRVQVLPYSRASFARLTREPVPPPIRGTATSALTLNNLGQLFKIMTIAGPLVSPVRFDSKEVETLTPPPDDAYEGTAPVASALFRKTNANVFQCVVTHGPEARTTGRRCDGLLLLARPPEGLRDVALLVEATLLAEATPPSPALASAPKQPQDGPRVRERSICTAHVTARIPLGAGVAFAEAPLRAPSK